MELSLIILKQTLTMALYMLIGYCLYKGKKIDAMGSKTVASMLLWMVIPSTIIRSFLVDFSVERLANFGISFLAGLIAVLLSLTVSKLMFKGRPVEQFAASFSNAGFIGIPLIQASLGSEAVFFLVGTIILLNIFQWTTGARMLSGDKKNAKKLTPKEVLLNPITVASLAGLVIFLTGLGTKLPSIISGCIRGVAALNAPLAMVVLGVYLAQTDLLTLITEKRLYLVSATRLLAIPLLTVLVLAFVPIDETVKLTILIAASAPAGANTAVYAQIYDGDYTYACKTVTQSTIMSIVTMPVVIALAKILIH